MGGPGPDRERELRHSAIPRECSQYAKVAHRRPGPLQSWRAGSVETQRTPSRAYCWYADTYFGHLITNLQPMQHLRSLLYSGHLLYSVHLLSTALVLMLEESVLTKHIQNSISQSFRIGKAEATRFSLSKYGRLQGAQFCSLFHKYMQTIPLSHEP